MLKNSKIKTFILVSGDLFLFYLALTLSFLIRYHFSFEKDILLPAFSNFFFVFLLWIFIFYIGRAYDLLLLKNKFSYYNRIFILLIVNIILTIIAFYAFSPDYQPKITLLFLFIFSLIFIIFWHRYAYNLFKANLIKTIIVSEDTQNNKLLELKNTLDQNSQLGYKILKVSSLKDFFEEKDQWLKKGVTLIVFDSAIFSSLQDFSSEEIFDFEIMELIDFYEMIFRKIPIDFLTLDWFVKNIFNRDWSLYESFKRVGDFLSGLLLFIIFLPLWPIIILMIKLESKGPVFYTSKRVGKAEKEFSIYKFRTMVKDASSLGPSWTLENDPRITKVGRFLRKSHLDELPQSLNVIKGEMSFVGPRPEEKKLVDLYKKEIPFYKMRFLIKPGIVGWAQINYPHTASVEEVKEKTAFDFYYLKNRSFILDIIIICRAIISIFEIKTH